MTKSTELKPNRVNHVVIVGGGFAGLNRARKLAANPNIQITLLDKNNYQQFQPLLYQVATGILAPDNIAFNLRAALRGHPNVDVKMTEVVSIDLNARTVETVTGSNTTVTFWWWRPARRQTFSVHRERTQNSYPLYSLHDAERLCSRILAMLESADRDPSLVAKGALNFVIVGAGPTGTEIAGAFGDMLQADLKKKTRDRPYKDLGVDGGLILLVDGGPCRAECLFLQGSDIRRQNA